MTNFEKYKDKLQELIDRDISIAVDKRSGTPWECNHLRCLDCAINSKEKSCKNAIVEWLLSEYEEPPVDWSKVPVDTPVLVKDREGNKWRRRYFAGIRGGMVTTYPEGRTSWSGNSIDYIDALISWPIAKLYKEDDKEQKE